MGKTNNKNLNAPGKGANVTVDPIRSLKDIQAISNTLKENPRNRLLFVMGINNGLRVAKRFKHSSPAITMRYLGIQDQEVYDSLMHDIC